MRYSLALVVLALLLAPVRPSAADGPCTFQNGFKAIHDAIPDVVGDCTGPETHEEGSAYVRQQTTGGTLAWRAADNWTAFSNGVRVWVLGPLGLQDRQPDHLLTWEPGAAELLAPFVGPWYFHAFAVNVSDDGLAGAVWRDYRQPCCVSIGASITFTEVSADVLVGSVTASDDAEVLHVGEVTLTRRPDGYGTLSQDGAAIGQPLCGPTVPIVAGACGA